MASFLDRLLGRRQQKHLLAIDVGSNTAVRSVLIEADSAGLDPRTRIKRHRELPARDEAHTTIAVIQNAIRRIIFECVQELRRVPDKTVIGLGSHFIFNAAERFHHHRPKPELKITIEEIKTLLGDQLAAKQNQHIGNSQWHLAVARPFVIEADGYPLEKLGGASRAKTLTFTLLNTYARPGYWQALQNLRSMHGGLEIDFVSNQTAIASIIIELLAVEEALILKIGAKITEVSYLKSRAIQLSGQFSFGGDDFTQAIARDLKISFGQAEELKKEIGKLNHDPVLAEKISSALQRASGKWLEHFVQFLDTEPNLVLPEMMFLLGGGARLEAIRNILVSSDWHHDFTFLPGINVVRLDAHDLSRMIFPKSSPPLNGPEEVALSGLVYRLLHQPEIFELSVP